MGGRSMKDVGGAVLAGSTPPFLGRERAAVDVDVGPERRSPRYHETCLALESVEEGSAAVSEPRCVWLRVHIVKDLEKARRLPVRVEEQQAQQLAMNPPRSAGDGRQEIQPTAMVPIELPSTLQSCLPPSRRGPCPGGRGEGALRSCASSLAQRPRGSAAC